MIRGGGHIRWRGLHALSNVYMIIYELDQSEVTMTDSSARHHHQALDHEYGLKISCVWDKTEAEVERFELEGGASVGKDVATAGNIQVQQIMVEVTSSQAQEKVTFIYCEELISSLLDPQFGPLLRYSILFFSLQSSDA